MIKLILSCVFIIFTYLHAASSWWGIHTQIMNKDMLESCGLVGERGIIVTSIDDESPAKGIVQRGDVITEVGGKKISTLQELNAFKETSISDKPVHVKVWRGNGFLDVSFNPRKEAGSITEELNDKILGNVVIGQMTNGVVVNRVNGEGLLQEGDKIVEVNNQKIQKVKDVKKALQKDDRSLSIVLDRKGTQIVQSFAVNNQGSFFSQTIISEGK